MLRICCSPPSLHTLAVSLPLLCSPCLSTSLSLPSLFVLPPGGRYICWLRSAPVGGLSLSPPGHTLCPVLQVQMQQGRRRPSAHLTFTIAPATVGKVRLWTVDQVSWSPMGCGVRQTGLWDRSQGWAVLVTGTGLTTAGLTWTLNWTVGVGPAACPRLRGSWTEGGSCGGSRVVVVWFGLVHVSRH